MLELDKSTLLQVVLFDVQQRTATAELNCPFLKYAIWSSDMSQVALLSKHAIIIADKRLQNSSTGHYSSLLELNELYLMAMPLNSNEYDSAYILLKIFQKYIKPSTLDVMLRVGLMPRKK